jgi:hypothetical protein
MILLHPLSLPLVLRLQLRLLDFALLRFLVDLNVFVLLQDWTYDIQDGILPHDVSSFKAKKGINPDSPTFSQAKILDLSGLADYNAKATPVDKDPLGPGTNADPPHDEPWEYAALLGCLMYLANNIRPDIQYAVHECARYTHHPMAIHSKAIKQIIWYLVGTSDKGIIFTPRKEITLDMYVGADFAGMWASQADCQDPIRVKSRTGYLILLAGCPLLTYQIKALEMVLQTIATSPSFWYTTFQPDSPGRSTSLHESLAEHVLTVVRASDQRTCC